MPPIDAAPVARTLASAAYQRIRNDIVSGTLVAGSKLKLEKLVREYEIGMSPLREALVRLVGDRLVITEDQRGFWVAPLSLDELDDISRVRTLIESEALRLSISNGDETWEHTLTAAFESLTDVEGTLQRTQLPVPQELFDLWEKRNQVFHTALVAACGSPWLIRLQELLYHQAERYRRVSLSQMHGRRFIHDEHVAIYDAAFARNVLRACRLTEEHLMRTYDAVRGEISRMKAATDAA